MMAGWTREQMIDAGLLVYAAVIKDVAHFAGVYEQDDWFLVDERTQLFRPLMNDEYGNSAIAELVGLISLTSQDRGPHHMARYSREPGEMWSSIPYSVLADDNWTAGVGPIGPGSHLAAGENGEVDDDPGQADPGRVQRGGESVPLVQVRPAACTTTTSG